MKQTSVLGLPNSRGFSVNTWNDGEPCEGIEAGGKEAQMGTPFMEGRARGGEMRNWGYGRGLCPGKDHTWTRGRPRGPRHPNWTAQGLPDHELSSH